MGKRDNDKFERKPRANSFKHGYRYANEGKPALEYKSWSGIKRRVLNPSDALYSYYGGRGIDMDPRWEVFTNFLEDIGPAPSKKHSVERVDNNKGYWKSNVKWATRKEQASNKRSTIRVNWLGYETCLKEACTTLCWNYKTVHRWLKEGKSLSYIDKRAKELWVKDQTL